MADGVHEGQGIASRGGDVEGRLRRYLIDELLNGFYDRPYDGDDPLADGEIDSLGAEQLIEFIEEELGVALEEDDIVAENFESLPTLTALVASKLRA